MTTLLEHEQLEEVAWEELNPPCECNLCNGVNPYELAAEHRHFEPGSCQEEKRVYLLCRSCYETIKRLTTVCLTCLEGASVYEL